MNQEMDLTDTLSHLLPKEENGRPIQAPEGPKVLAYYLITFYASSYGRSKMKKLENYAKKSLTILFLKNKMKITLQQIKIDEWQTLADLEKRSASPLFHPLEGEKTFRDYLSKSKVFYILADGNKIGTISYEPKEEYYEVDGMTILPEYRKKGYAREAFSLMLSEPKIKKNWLLVTHPENTASLLIYLKAGFKIKEWKDNYFGDGEPRLLLIRNN